MKNTSNWFSEFKTNIETISEKKIKPKEVRFYNLGGFIDIGKRLDEYSKNCSECEAFKAEAMEISQNIDNYINTSVALRKEFEKKRDKFSKHLKEVHGLVKKNTYAATYAFIGLLIGALGGYLFAKVYLFAIGEEILDFTKISVLIGWTLGIVGGRILGVMKDNKIKKEEKYY